MGIYLKKYKDDGFWKENQLWKQLLLGNMPIEFISLGRWWGNDPRKRSQTEIDIMGEQDSNSAIFAECKWKNENVDLDVLETLIERSGLFHYTKIHYFLFSKTGFTKGCMEKAKEIENLSPQRQLTLLMQIYRFAKEGAQFFIVTHSPILLGIPDADIYCFDNGRIHLCEYEETESYHITEMFINNRQHFLTYFVFL